jgi:hypothetical protein
LTPSQKNRKTAKNPYYSLDKKPTKKSQKTLKKPFKTSQKHLKNLQKKSKKKLFFKRVVVHVIFQHE